MYRFFVEKNRIQENLIEICGADVNHIKNVLRMRVGEPLLVSDGEDREYLCRICEIGKEHVMAQIEDVNGPCRELPVKVTLFQALPKGDKMETIIQKMVELGVCQIVPVRTKRCVVKLDEKKAENKVKRWNTISLSAAKQSKRGIVPEVFHPVTFQQALEQAKQMDLVLIPYENAEGIAYTRSVLEKINPKMQVGIFIGPEGGFTLEEVTKAKEAGALEITLGKRILRTETAGMALMSAIMILNEQE